MAYDIFASDAAPTADLFVLTSGLGCNMMVYPDAFCIKLAESGPFRVMRYDNRDAGRSTAMGHMKLSVLAPLLLFVPKWMWRGAPPYTLDDMADDTAALVAHVGAARAHFGGSSMGGMISQLMAIRHPAMVMSIASMDSSTSAWDLPRSTTAVRLQLMQKPKSDALGDVIDCKAMQMSVLNWPPQCLDDAAWAFIRECAVRQKTYSAGDAAASARHVAAISRAAPRDEQLRLLRVPAVVIHGEDDVMLNVAHGRRTAACIPGSRLVVLKDCAHGFMPASNDLKIAELVAVAARATTAAA
jgi:pimeloyl-ACP methyl ester carboxylesterase